MSQTDRLNPFNVVEFEIVKQGEYFISVVQKSERYLKNPKDYEYSEVRMILARKIDGDKLE